MKELIDREMAIKEIENEFAEVLTSHGYDSYEKADLFYQLYCEGLMKAIGILLDMEAEQPRWIPCSERLPEDDLCVTLVTDGINVWVETWVGIVGKWKYNHSTITAWMTLPEPYEERREADEH